MSFALGDMAERRDWRHIVAMACRPHDCSGCVLHEDPDDGGSGEEGLLSCHTREAGFWNIHVEKRPEEGLVAKRAASGFGFEMARMGGLRSWAYSLKSQRFEGADSSGRGGEEREVKKNERGRSPWTDIKIVRSITWVALALPSQVRMDSGCVTQCSRSSHSLVLRPNNIDAP